MSCPNTNSPEWKDLVNKIGVFEAMREFVKNGEQIPDANKYDNTFQGVNATLKIVNALQKTPRQSYPSNQIQGFYNDLIKYGAPKDQIELLKDHIARNNIKEINTNELITSLLAESGYTVEINTSMRKYDNLGQTFNEHEHGFEYGGFTYSLDDYYADINGMPDFTKHGYINGKWEDIKITEQEFNEAQEKAGKTSNSQMPTQVYSNLTVPGGTNYTENELRTPAITPSIRGHAQFATANGIGWFRSDERGKVDSKKPMFWVMLNGINQKEFFTKEEAEDFIKLHSSKRGYKESDYSIKETSSEVFNESTKTRRILEVQSDLFQKGRDRKDLIGRDVDKEISEQFGDDQVQYITNQYRAENDKSRTPENNFLQLLNKDNNWVGLFVKSIIQDSARKGYENVLFPSGDTAAKVEGHQTVEDFINNKQGRLDTIKQYNYVVTQKAGSESLGSFVDLKDAEKALAANEDIFGVKNEIGTYIIVPAEGFYSREIEQLEKEISDAKAGKLKISAVANFYENNIANILKKNGYSPIVITDEYDNKWNQVTIKENAKDTIFFNKPGVIQSKASAKTLSKIKSWLDKVGISVEAMRTDKTQVSSSAYGDAQGVAILLNNVIKIADGKQPESLVEESMHFLEAMLLQGNKELHNKMMNRIGSSNMYQQVKNTYATDPRYVNEQGEPDIVKLKREAVAKTLAEYYIKGDTQEDGTFLSRVKSWWDAIVDWVKSLVNANGDPFQEAIDTMDSVSPETVDPEHIKSLATQIRDSIPGDTRETKGIRENIDHFFNAGNYIDVVKFISDQLADPATFDRVLEQMSWNDKLANEILQLRGEFAQLSQDDTFKPFTDREKEYNLTKHEDNIDPDDEFKGSHYTITVDGKNKVIDRATDFAKRQNAKKSKRDYLAEASDEQLALWEKVAMEGTNGHSDMENIITQATNEDGTLKPMSEIKLGLKPATNKAIYNKFVQYLLGNTKQAGFLSTFPIGTKFKTEIRILDPNAKSKFVDENGDIKDLTGRAGTIDLLAILPDGSAKIYDWKFMGFLLDKADQSFLKRAQHSLQLGEYKRILGTYGIKNVEGFTIPIHAEYKYNVDKDSGETFPQLTDVVMGNTRMKDEDRTPLLSVVPEGQSTGNELIDQLVRRLVAKYNRVYKQPVGEDEYDNKISSLNQLSGAIRNLQVALNFAPLAAEAINFTNSITRILDKYKDTDFKSLSFDERNAAIEELLDGLNTSDYYASIDEAFVSQYGNDNLTDKQKETLNSLRSSSAISKEKSRDLLKQLQKLVDSIAVTEDFNNYLTPMKEATGMMNDFLNASNLPNRSLQLAAKIVSRERSKDALEIARESDKFKALYLAALKATNGKDVFDSIANRKTHELIPIVDKKFYDTIKEAKNKKDRKVLMESIDYKEYQRLLKERLDKKVADINDTVYSTNERENNAKKIAEKTRARRQLDFTRDDFFGWNDSEFSSLIRKSSKDTEHYTKEYKELQKNPALLALHTYFIGLNQRAKDLGYLSRSQRKLFLPYITGTMLQRLAQNNNKLSSLRNSITDKFLVRDDDKKAFGKFDEETGELERNIPTYFTSDVRGTEDYSTDLIQLATKYIQALQEFQTSKELEDTFLAMHKIEQNKGHLQTERGRVIFDGEKPKVFEGNEKNATLLQKYIDDEIYGITEDSSNILNKLIEMTVKRGTEEEKENKKISLMKSIQFGNLMTQQLAVGFKALVAIPNYVGAHLQSAINSGRYWGYGEYLKTHARVVTSTLTSIEKAAIHYLIPLNENVSLEKRREIALKESVGKWIGTWTFNDAMMSTNRIPDKAHELTNALVWMDNTMLDEKGNMVNIRKYYQQKIGDRYSGSHEDLKQAEANLDKQVKEAKEKLAITKIAKFDEQGHFVIPGLNDNTTTVGAYRAQILKYGRYITGQMSREDKANYRRNIIARSFMMFKNWIPEQVQLRALDIHKNPILGDWEYGRTRLFFKTLAHLGFRNMLKIRDITTATPEGIRIMREMLEEKKEDYYKKTGQQLDISDVEFFDMVRKELKSEYKELALLVGIVGLLLAAKLALPPDDDDDPLTRNRHKQLLRAVNKISDELYFYWSPLSSQAITQGTVIPSIGILSKVTQLFEHSATELFGFDWNTRQFGSQDVRDRNQVVKYFLNLTPIASQFSGEILPIVDPALATDLGYKISTQNRQGQQ